MAQPFWEGAVEGGICDWGEVVSNVATLAGNGECKTRLFAGNPVYPVLPVVLYATARVLRTFLRKDDGDNASGADNQQGSRFSRFSLVELTPQRLHAELLETTLEKLDKRGSVATRDPRPG